MTRWGMVLDLARCIGCNACTVACKIENGTPPDHYWARVYTEETGTFPDVQTTYVPALCNHCADAPCVTVCPTGASYKRAADGIVLVDYDKCIGCKYCAWACPYGAREIDEERQVMTKCTLCVDRVYDAKLAEADRQPACVKACPTGARLFGDVKDPQSEVSKAIRERGGYSLMPEWQTKPANQYLPRRPTTFVGATTPMPSARDLS